MKQSLFGLLFYAVLFVGFAFNCRINWSRMQDIVRASNMNISEKVRSIDQLYANVDIGKREWINLYGFSQRVLDKRQIENFSIYKNQYERLVEPKNPVSEGSIRNAIKDVCAVTDYCHDRGIELRYITSILPIDSSEDLPVGAVDYSHENADKLFHILNDNKIPIIDLRKSYKVLEIPEENRFYKTDHHWTLESCFAAFQTIILEISAAEDAPTADIAKILNKENYTLVNYPHSFLGSYGVKVGEYYAGMDDFKFLIPNFSTSITFSAYDQTQNLIQEISGEFQEAFIDHDILKNTTYYNKYNAFANGKSIENHIINHQAASQKKILLIAHSYGRPLSMYLSLYAQEVRHLDPQEGRFEGNILDYIDDYEPDMVLIMTEFEGEYIFPLLIE